MDVISELAASMEKFKGDESEFLAVGAELLSALSEVEPWSYVTRIVDGIKGNNGFSTEILDRLIPLTDSETHKDFSVSLLFTGVTQSRYRSSEFLGLETRASRLRENHLGSGYMPMVYKVLDGEFHYQEYKTNISCPEQVNDPDIYKELVLQSCQEKTATRGEVIVRDKRSTIIFPSEESKSVLLVLAGTKYVADFQFKFNSKTGQLVGISDTHPRTSRKIKAISIIEKYGSNNALPALKFMAASDHHFIRWLSIKAMVNIDPQNAAEHLSLGKDDRNSEIRNTCNRLLDKVVSA